MIDQFKYSCTWLLIVFNNTIVHLYRQYHKKLAWDDSRLIFKKLSNYTMAIYNIGGRSIFWEFMDGTLNITCWPVLDQK